MKYKYPPAEIILEGSVKRTCEAARLDLTLLGAAIGTTAEPCPELGETFVHDFLLCPGCAGALRVAQELRETLGRIGGGLEL